MRVILFIAAAALFAGCSSETKKEATAVATEAKADAKAAATKTVEKTKAEAKKSIPAIESVSTGTKVECAVKGDSRTIEVREKGKGCELVYTKAGKEGVVASAANSKDYCVTAMDKLTEKLKGSGYECK